MNPSKEKTGTCTECGKTKCHITIVDQKNEVCDECLETNYFLCEDCGEYWNYDYVDFNHLKNGKLVCEYCQEDYDDDEIDYDYQGAE